VGQSGEFAASTTGDQVRPRRGAVVISTQRGEMQAEAVAQVVLQPEGRTGNVRQMPFGAQPHGATA
jgi:hypothetical protein